MKTIYKQGTLLFTLALLFLNGCASVSSRVAHHQVIDAKIEQRDFETAVRHLEENRRRNYQAKDRVLYYLDAGMLNHYNRDYEKSNELLTQAEYAMEELFTRSISRAAASLLLNDNVLEYTGEDYEDIYTNVFKAINFIKLDEFDKAFVEIRRINEKLNMLEDRYADLARSYKSAEEAEIDFKPGTSRFHNSILGRYLSMLIYRTEGRMDAAMIDYNHILDGWQQQSHIYNFPMPDLSSHLEISNKAKVNFISFIGRAPRKSAYERRITTFSDYIIVSGNEPEYFAQTLIWPGMDKDFHFTFSLPFLKRQDSQISRVNVYVNGKQSTQLELIEDIGNIAQETFNVKAPIIYIKSITRSVVKGLLAEQAKSRVSERSGRIESFLFRIAADIAVELSENADLRHARYFPGQALIGEMELEPGIYDIRVLFYNRSGAILDEYRYEDFVVERDKLNLINTICLS